jgi:formylglycine-generating enzyme required for sulfatase activity
LVEFEWAFDPYHEWLGISPDEQPPNYYRLLGIRDVETSPSVIEHAADQRMLHIRTFQNGRHAAASQQLLNEIAQAKLCLLNPESKAGYDARLKADQAVHHHPIAAADKPPRLKTNGQNSIRAKNTGATALVVVLGGAGLLVAALLLWLGAIVMSGGQPQGPDARTAALAADKTVEAPGKTTVSQQSTNSHPTINGADVTRPPSKAGEVREFTDLQLEFCWCPPGSFKMGDAKAKVDVTLSKGFWLGRTEVTQGSWTAVMGTTPWSDQKKVKDGSGYPAVYVNWYEAREFCRKLTERERRSGRSTGWKYDLPTQAQWEYACRAGTETVYSFGDDTGQLGEHAWFEGNAKRVGQHYAHAVASTRANLWGLHDMHGNAHEWCRDRHVDQLPGGVDPEGNGKSEKRVFGGGSWNSRAQRCRSASRISSAAEFRDISLGFRVARVPQIQSPKKTAAGP